MNDNYLANQASQILDNNHHHFDCTDSTNSQLIADIAHGRLDCNHCHLYTASIQTAGRGQHGRSWVSDAGNVFLSLYIPIGQPNTTIYLKQLSGILSLAVGFFLHQLPIIQSINIYRTNNRLSPIGVKWANDVGIYDQTLDTFLKLAGILIEPVFQKNNHQSQLVGVVTGIGLNVQHTPIITDGLYQATSLKDLIPSTDSLPSLGDLYSQIVQAILQAVITCNALNKHKYLTKFIDHFNQSHILTNRWVQIFIQNDMTNIYTQGKCLCINEQGGLILQTQQGIQSIFAGMAQLKKDTQ